MGESRKALLYGFDRLYFLWSSKRRKELGDTPWYDRWSALFSKPSVSLWVYNIFENISTIYKASYKIEVTKIEKGLKDNAFREKGSLNNEWKTNENTWLGCDLLSVMMYVSYFPQIMDNLTGHKGNLIQPLVSAINCSLWVYYRLFKKERDILLAAANAPGIIFGLIAAITAL